MKRLLLAGPFLLIFALSGARADPNDAYGSLVGMADSASRDQGPQAGEISPARAGKSAKKAPAPAPGARSEAAKDNDAPFVAVPAAAAPRAWTRLFSSLLPPMARVPFGVAVSTALAKN